MKPRICPKCKGYMSEDYYAWWCEACDFEINKTITERIEDVD